MEDNHKISMFWLIKNSLKLDLKFLKRNNWSFFKKIYFLVKKYYSILIHILKFKKFKLGESKIKFEGRDLYYNSSFGITDYQSILTRHKMLLNFVKLEDPKLIVDIGANVGFLSMLFSETFPKAQIISFEPVPVVYKCITENTKHLKNVKVENMGLSNFTGKAYMDVNEEDSVVSHLSEKPTGVETEIDTLDNYMKKNNLKNIDLLKIDVETFEKEVLEGATETLKNTKYLMVEITMKGNDRYTFSELAGMLYTKDYNFQLIAFRNFNDSGEGYIPLGDFLLINTNLK
jgi:FkbM family methyltransferase